MKAYDLGERIESTRFLGREFFVFVWWLSEIGEGTVMLPGHGDVELHLDAMLVLERQAEGVESCRLKGADPSTGKEAKEALRDGKLPTRAHVQLSQAEKAFSFAWNADTLATSGVKIPALLTDAEDDGFFERMQLIEELETLLLCLFEQFLRLRLATEWEMVVAPAIRRWVKDEPTMSRAEYEGLRDRMVARGKKR